MIKHIQVSPGCKEIPQREINTMCQMMDKNHSGSGGRHKMSMKRDCKTVNVVYQNGYISIYYEGEV